MTLVNLRGLGASLCFLRFSLCFITLINLLYAQNQEITQILSNLDQCYQQIDYQCVDQNIKKANQSKNLSQLQQYQLKCYALLLAFAQEQEPLVRQYIDDLIQINIEVDFSLPPMKYLPDSINNQIKLAQDVIHQKIEQINQQQKEDQKKLEEKLQQELAQKLNEAKKQQEEQLKLAQLNQEITQKSYYQFYASGEAGLFQTNGLDQRLWQSGLAQSYSLGILKNNSYQRKNGEHIKDEKSFRLSFYFNLIDLGSQVVYLNELKSYHLQIAYAFELKNIEFNKTLTTAFELGFRLGGEYINPTGLIRLNNHLGANIQGDFRWVWGIAQKIDILLQSSIQQSFVIDNNRIAWSWFPIYSVGLRFPIMILGG